MFSKLCSALGNERRRNPWNWPGRLTEEESYWPQSDLDSHNFPPSFRYYSILWAMCPWAQGPPPPAPTDQGLTTSSAEWPPVPRPRQQHQRTRVSAARASMPMRTRRRRGSAEASGASPLPSSLTPPLRSGCPRGLPPPSRAADPSCYRAAGGRTPGVTPEELCRRRRRVSSARRRRGRRPWETTTAWSGREVGLDRNDVWVERLRIQSLFSSVSWYIFGEPGNAMFDIHLPFRQGQCTWVTKSNYQDFNDFFFLLYFDVNKK